MCGVEIPSYLFILDLFFCETFFVLVNGVNKIELFIPWVEVVQTALMYSELHVGFPFRISMENEHHLVAPVDDEVLETKVSQDYDIGDGVFTKPHTIVVSIHRCLVGHNHCADIDTHSHFRF